MTPTIPIALTLDELELVMEALQARAARHEAYSRFNPRAAGRHDRRAVAMHKLFRKLVAIPTEDVLPPGYKRTV